jgi:hypothetical protein
MRAVAILRDALLAERSSGEGFSRALAGACRNVIGRGTLPKAFARTDLDRILRILAIAITGYS